MHVFAGESRLKSKIDITISKYSEHFAKINYLNRGAQGIDIVALGIDFVAVIAWAQSDWSSVDYLVAIEIIVPIIRNIYIKFYETIRMYLIGDPSLGPLALKICKS